MVGASANEPIRHVFQSHGLSLTLVENETTFNSIAHLHCASCAQWYTRGDRHSRRLCSARPWAVHSYGANQQRDRRHNRDARLVWPRLCAVGTKRDLGTRHRYPGDYGPPYSVIPNLARRAKRSRTSRCFDYRTLRHFHPTCLLGASDHEFCFTFKL